MDGSTELKYSEYAILFRERETSWVDNLELFQIVKVDSSCRCGLYYIKEPENFHEYTVFSFYNFLFYIYKWRAMH